MSEKVEDEKQEQARGTRLYPSVVRKRTVRWTPDSDGTETDSSCYPTTGSASKCCRCATSAISKAFTTTMVNRFL